MLQDWWRDIDGVLLCNDMQSCLKHFSIWCDISGILICGHWGFSASHTNVKNVKSRNVLKLISTQILYSTQLLVEWAHVFFSKSVFLSHTFIIQKWTDFFFDSIFGSPKPSHQKYCTNLRLTAYFDNSFDSSMDW